MASHEIEHICNCLNCDFSKNLMQPKSPKHDSTAFQLLSYCLLWPSSELQHTVHFLQLKVMQNTSLYVTDWASLNGTSVPIACKEIYFFCWPAFLGCERLTTQRISWFWWYIDQSDPKYYRNLNNPIPTLFKGNYNFLVETNGCVTGECEIFVQILKRKSFGWALIPLLSVPFLLDGVHIRCRWP